jgi:hypothetical protein
VGLAVGVASVVLVIVVVVWFFTARSPADKQGVERPTPAEEPHPERSSFGPAGPDAEAQVPPQAGP